MREIRRKKKARGRLAGDLRVVLDGMDVMGLSFAKFSSVLVVDGRRLGLENISAWVGRGKDSGPMDGSLSYFGKSGFYRGNLVSGFDPSLLCPFLHETGLHGLARFVGTFSFAETSPCLRVDFTGNTLEKRVDVLGAFEGRSFSYNNVTVVHGHSPVKVEIDEDRELVTLDSLAVKRPEGNAQVRLEVDLLRNQVAFDGVSSLNPVALAGLISRKGPAYIGAFRFGGPVKLCARGVVNYETERPFDVEAQVEAESLGLWRFEAEKCGFAFLRSGGCTTVSDVKAEVCGGQVSGWAYFHPDGDSGELRYRMSCKARNTAFREVAEAIVGELPSKEGYTGNLSGNVVVEGMAGEDAWNTINGRGNLGVRDGKILRLPLFGGLSAILVRVVPGLGYVLNQTDALADFTIESGNIRSSNLRIEGDILSLRSAGSYGLADNSLDFKVELRFLKKKTFVGDILQTILLPVSKMFKMKLSGTIDNPRWNTVNF
jgi:hypothetical protein